MDSHSLRRGGATQLLIDQWSIENIMESGRWASVTSAKLYLPQSEVAPLRCRGDVPEEVERVNGAFGKVKHSFALEPPRLKAAPAAWTCAACIFLTKVKRGVASINLKYLFRLLRMLLEG